MEKKKRNYQIQRNNSLNIYKKPLKSSIFYMILNFLILIFNFTPFVFAEEHEAPAHEGNTNSETSESEVAEKEKAGAFIKKDEYLELNAAIEQLSAKVKSKNENLTKMLIDKDSIKDSLAFKEIVKKIEIEYREIKDLLENIEKKKSIIRNRFPERSFVKNGSKAKEQKNEEASMDSVIEKKVNQLLKLVESQYKEKIIPKKAEVSEISERKPASENKETSEANQNPDDFSRPLLLKK